MDDLKDLFLKNIEPVQLDSVSAEKRDQLKSRFILDAAENFVKKDIQYSVVHSIQEWLETTEEDLSGNEDLADRLLALLVGIADDEQDGELDENELDVLNVAIQAAWAYFADNEVEEEDIDALLNDWDGDAAERVRDFLVSILPDDEDLDGVLDDFVFSEAEQVSIFDSAYKNIVAVRDGKKVKIKKRISGAVKLTAKQKAAIKKAQLKSRSSSAKKKRLKSMRVREKLGL